MCESCAYRPEMVRCSQCRTPLYAPDGTERISRNRALEELARKTFPAEQGESAVGRGRGNRGGRARGRANTARGGARGAARMPEFEDEDDEEEEDQSVIVRLLRLAGHRLSGHHLVLDFTE